MSLTPYLSTRSVLYLSLNIASSASAKTSRHIARLCIECAVLSWNFLAKSVHRGFLLWFSTRNINTSTDSIEITHSLSRSLRDGYIFGAVRFM